jgi:NAD(P)-dependent dehydrogenase (short-subunit alcohol dehydrogenase family)
MLLEDRNAVIYGGGGKVGGAVARAFAREGARVFLAGRTITTLDEVAEDIVSAGGVAETAQVDALDEQSIEKHIGEVMERAGSVDVSFNAISIQDVQLTPLLEMSREDFMRPIHTGVYVGGFGIACTAIEALTKQLAAEVGPDGIRVNCLRSEGIPESWEGASTGEWSAPPKEIEAFLKQRSLLGRVTTLADVGNAAAFMASDRAGATTGTVFNLTSGTVVD